MAARPSAERGREGERERAGAQKAPGRAAVGSRRPATQGASARTVPPRSCGEGGAKLASPSAGARGRGGPRPSGNETQGAWPNAKPRPPLRPKWEGAPAAGECLSHKFQSGCLLSDAFLPVTPMKSENRNVDVGPLCKAIK
ncbi:translation initiation factor IF-2-like [Prionailurus viverrinus]|uniref:translation initiation factor IF-2-like n=1 Tax=Prionailurus viverrinus TaxID=61388 RepID=UPI001FF44ED7|nr:translation initiation factor IF-2-like [Prionailurus viverrinus]